MREALDGGAKIGVIAGTCSTPDERIADAALAALGPQLAEHLRVYPLTSSRWDAHDPLLLNTGLRCSNANPCKIILL